MQRKHFSAHSFLLSPGELHRQHHWEFQLHTQLLQVFQPLPGSSNSCAGIYKVLQPQMPRIQSWSLTLQIPLHCSGAGSIAHTWMQQLQLSTKKLFSKTGMKSVIKCENLYIIQKADAGQLLKANSTPHPALVWLEPASGTHPSWGNVHRAGQPSSASCCPPTGAGDNLCPGTFFF